MFCNVSAFCAKLSPQLPVKFLCGDLFNKIETVPARFRSLVKKSSCFRIARVSAIERQYSIIIVFNRCLPWARTWRSNVTDWYRINRRSIKQNAIRLIEKGVLSQRYFTNRYFTYILNQQRVSDRLKKNP